MVDYCDVADVKPVLHLDLVESSEDLELVGCVLTGSGLVDGFLQVKGLTVPGVVPPIKRTALINHVYIRQKILIGSKSVGALDVIHSFDEIATFPLFFEPFFDES